jgi:tetratricopeptide (TPR) repeat protein
MERPHAMRVLLPALTVAFAAVGCAPAVAVGPKRVDGTNLQVRLEPARSEPAEEGNALAAVEDFAGAAVGFRRAVDADPGDDAALFNLGLMREKLGDFSRARDAYRAAILLADHGKYREGLLRVLNRMDLDAGAAERTVRAGSPAPRSSGPVARAEPPPADLRLKTDAVPPEPKSARPAEPTVAVKTPTTSAPAEPPAAVGKAEPIPPAATPKSAPPEPVLPPARARVLVLQTAPPAGEADGLRRSVGGAAEWVEWKLSSAGAVLLADTTTLPREEAAAARRPTWATEARRLAAIGRAAGADAVMLLDAAATATPGGTVRVVLRARTVNTVTSTEGAPISVSAEAAADRAETAAGAALRKACEELSARWSDRFGR